MIFLVSDEDNDQSSEGDVSSDSDDEYDYEAYLKERQRQILSGKSESEKWYSQNVPFKMYQEDGNEVPTDTYGEITSLDEEEAKVCLHYYYNYLLTF